MQLTDWLSHVPKEVVAKNFQTSISAFNNVPSQELYIFPSSMYLILHITYHLVPLTETIFRILAPPNLNQQPPNDPQGGLPSPFTFALSQVKPQQKSGGTVKIVDETTFPVATQLSALEVTVEPGAMRFVPLPYPSILYDRTNAARRELHVGYGYDTWISYSQACNT